MNADDLTTFETFLDQVVGIRLHGSREHGPALKKPLLLLLVVSMLDRGTLKDNHIQFSDIRDELDALIRGFGGRPTGHGTRPEQPFSHLRTSPFWHLTTEVACPNSRTVPVSDLMHTASFGALDEKVFALLEQSPYLRARVVELVLDLWWSETLHGDLRGALRLVLPRVSQTAPRDPSFSQVSVGEIREGFRAIFGRAG